MTPYPTTGLRRLAARPRFASGALGVAGGLVLATVVLHAAGGTHTVFPHLYYFPIVVAAVLWGPAPGIAVGLVAGILAGPLTPLDVDAGTSQTASSWLIRLGFFSAVGGVTGTFALALATRMDELARLNDQTVQAFVRAVDARDAYTARHSEKVAAYAVEIADLLRLDAGTRERIRWAGLLHDLGKLALPESILGSEGPLDDHQWSLVKRHPGDSERIVAGVERYQAYLPAIRHHHERYDGAGYPDGLRGEAIPLEARVLAVADAFDAMTSDRSYRGAMSEEEALERVAAGAGSQFDPGIAAAFTRSRGLADPEAVSPDLRAGSRERSPLAGRLRPSATARGTRLRRLRS